MAAGMGAGMGAVGGMGAGMGAGEQIWLLFWGRAGLKIFYDFGEVFQGRNLLLTGTIFRVEFIKFIYALSRPCAPSDY